MRRKPLSVLVIFLEDGGVLGRLDDPGAWIDERLSEFFASSGIGQPSTWRLDIGLFSASWRPISPAEMR